MGWGFCYGCIHRTPILMKKYVLSGKCGLSTGLIVFFRNTWWWLFQSTWLETVVADLVFIVSVCFLSRWNLILLLSVCSAVLSGEGDYRAQGKQCCESALLDVHTCHTCINAIGGGVNINATYILYILYYIIFLENAKHMFHCWRRVA